MKSEIKVGDKVRSFDFAIGEYGRELTGERASYVEGTVIEIGDAPTCAANCPHYHIEVEREVLGGRENMRELVGKTVYPNVHGDFAGLGPVEAIN